ncbi:hypothetical protein AALO_G00133800 [Alosa alosa]|uniref:Uncharacterized protein n=1 Tax=Alosa alosa TaxID=278164 RepID=A0AAV6GJR6_9TELE|nr:hypothetical protein AALO_G00133800 [Alosa alosa]
MAWLHSSQIVLWALMIKSLSSRLPKIGLYVTVQRAQDRSIIKVSFIKVLQNVRTRHHLLQDVCCVCVGREEIMAAIDQNHTIGLLRACNLKALVYLSEGFEKLIKEYLDAD